jgi:hypothetical protein
MSAISIPQLFSFLESQVGRPALATALAAYLSVPADALKAEAPSTPPKASSAPSDAPAAPKKAKRVKDPNAPKKEPNAWILFTGRVRAVLAPLAPEGKKLLPVAVTQTSSALKDAGLMPSATDEQIRAAYAEWQANPPAVGKWKAAHPERKHKSKASDASSASSASSTSSVAKSLNGALEAVAEVKPKKHRGPKKLTEMTPEELEAHNAKKAARKAEKDAKKTAPVPALPPSPKLEPAAVPELDSVMDFEPFTWKKLHLFKNSRGDVITEDMEWFGKWVGDKMDVSVPQPEDLDL